MLKLTQFKTLTSMKKQLGVTMIEYALIAALIAIVAIVSLTSIGTNLVTKFQLIATDLAK